jgi:radical SAM protein with 4Fe4S-binding SPASM domain
MKNESYREIGVIRPLINKFRRIGLNPKYYSYRLQWHLVSRYHFVTKYPTHVDFETTNHCNMKCVMCPHADNEHTFHLTPKGMMDLGLYKKIVTELAAGGTYSIKLNYRGEPLLHKHLVEMVRFAKEKGILEVMFTTNGYLLTKEKAQQLVDAGIDYIIISIDGATKETYEAIRPGGEFDRLVENIKYLSNYRREKGLKKPLIRTQFVKMKENIHEVEMYKEMWRPYVDVMAANDFSLRVGQENKSVRDMVAFGRATCPHPFRRLTITWDGEVLMCCGDWSKVNVIGDTKKNSIHEIWHSETMYQMRDLLKKKELDKIASCKNCYVLASYEWKRAPLIKRLFSKNGSVNGNRTGNVGEGILDKAYYESVVRPEELTKPGEKRGVRLGC